MKKQMTKLEAIRDLAQHDHSFLKPEYARKIGKVFGFSPDICETADTRSFYKGLTLHGINPKTGKEFEEGDTAEGIDSYELAMAICKHLKVEYEDYFGIGSQLRECCSKVEKFLIANN